MLATGVYPLCSMSFAWCITTHRPLSKTKSNLRATLLIFSFIVYKFIRLDLNYIQTIPHVFFTTGQYISSLVTNKFKQPCNTTHHCIPYKKHHPPSQHLASCGTNSPHLEHLTITELSKSIFFYKRLVWCFTLLKLPN